ncbi:basic amino acid ABC transporter substrate-binding protein [Salidesulfovibrio brasiliensis]|uniref:basic amino acid ABC transporter substrate-binding protein n=1 Tax=Salidesulfovibrio brasiliensis TaxID=221711 RepID=UPI0006D23233|nr:basic amino acid ABC transporter substrate-binding protein [Salidesulfovibrio brasiliensis]
MKKMSKILVTVMALVMVMGAAATANAGMWDKIKEDGVIIVGNSPDYPPYENMDGDKRVGFDIDLMEAMAKHLGVDVKWKTMGFDTIIAAVTMKQVDIGFSGFGITEERKRSVDFSEPYYRSGQVIVVTPGSDIKSGEDLKGKRVAAQIGTTGVEAAKKVEGTEVVEPENWSVAFMMLKTKSVDAVVADIPVADEFAKKQGFVIAPEPLTEELNAIIVPKGNQDLVDALNGALAKVKADGTLDKLVEKWMK